ncbi:hypothetical protein KPATCC21470_7985 [Kitasatospora purpeofusca]
MDLAVLGESFGPGEIRGSAASWRTAYDLNADESRYLTDPARAAAYEQSFFDRTQSFARVGGATLGSCNSELAALANTHRADHAAVGFGGFLGDELRNITFAGEQEEAERVLAAFQAYQQDDRKIRQFNAQGRLMKRSPSTPVWPPASPTPTPVFSPRRSMTSRQSTSGRWTVRWPPPTTTSTPRRRPSAARSWRPLSFWPRSESGPGCGSSPDGCVLHDRPRWCAVTGSSGSSGGPPDSGGWRSRAAPSRQERVKVIGRHVNDVSSRPRVAPTSHNVGCAETVRCSVVGA